MYEKDSGIALFYENEEKGTLFQDCFSSPLLRSRLGLSGRRKLYKSIAFVPLKSFQRKAKILSYTIAISLSTNFDMSVGRRS